MTAPLDQKNPVALSQGFRDILAIVDTAGDQPAARTAIDLALAFDAHVTGLSLVYDLYLPFMGYGVLPADVIVEARRSALAQAAAAARRFEGEAGTAGCRFSARSEDNIFFGDFSEVLSQARLTDLVVVRRDTNPAKEGLRTPLIEAILFDAGTPVLIVPEQTEQIGRTRALVAWDGSARAAHALRSAMPMLVQSERVDVVTVEGGNRTGGPRLADVGSYLSRHGIAAVVRTVEAAGRSPAEAILQLAKEEASDFLVMGAYEHSRFRQHLFGGATVELLRDAPLPVLMTH